MRKIIFYFFLFFIFLGGLSYGETIFEAPCENGGSITVDSSGFSYNQATGEYSIVFQINNCKEDEYTEISGTLTSSGLFHFTAETQAHVVINTSGNVTYRCHSCPDNGPITNSCSGHYEGTYDLNNETLDGNYSLHCNGSSNRYEIKLFSLLLGPSPSD